MLRPRIILADLRDHASRFIPNVIVGSVEVSASLVADAPTPAQTVLARHPSWSILVYALPIVDEVLWAWHHVGGVRYLFANYVLERLAAVLQELLRSKSVETIDVAANFAGTLSLVELAARAGLGSRGMNNLLLHPEYGSWLQLHALLADCTILGEERQELDVCTRCAACVEACPASAIDADQFYPRRCSALVASPWMPKSKAIALTNNSYIECAECIRQCPIGAAAEGLLQWKR